MPTLVRLCACLLSCCLAGGCLSLPRKESRDDAEVGTLPGKLVEDASAGVESALARAGVSLADLPEDLAAPMPGEGAVVEGGVLPTELPELGEDLEETLPEVLLGGESADAPGGWHRSGERALELARGRGVPLVIWFANPTTGPLDERLGIKVLFDPAVSRLLSRQAVGLKIDFGNETTRLSNYYQAFRKKYKVTGYPTLVFLQPDGTEVTRQIGFAAGTEAARIQNFGFAIERAAKAWQNRKKDLEKSGFKTWKDRSGRTFFAKPLRREGKEMVLIDPYRRIYRVPLERLAHESLVDALDIQEPAPSRKE
ncbi:MAG: hypothetical protein ACKO2G_02805 [Verrucomicrobiales bacterium]